MIGRYITGIGTGIETSTVPMYQSELCEADKRGRLVSSEPLFVGVGIEIAYWLVRIIDSRCDPAGIASLTRVQVRLRDELHRRESRLETADRLSDPLCFRESFPTRHQPLGRPADG